jgi:SagB-type dehydrogenase family enzyme
VDVKRNALLFGQWRESSFEVLSPVDARTRIRLPDKVRRLVDGLSSWTPVELAVKGLTSDEDRREQALATINTLIDHQVLVSDDDPGHDWPEHPWQEWGGVAALFHRHTRDAPYIVNLSDKIAYTEQIAQTAPPAFFKAYPELPRVPLPRTNQRLEAPFDQVLLGRRTHRQFRDQQVSFEHLSTLLQLSFGPQRFADGGVFGTVPLRTSPNAGGRNEIEAYVVAFDVSDLSPGLYHYDSDRHGLERLRVGADRATLRDLLCEQKMADTAPLVVLTTTVADRIAYKYQDGRAYRLWMYNIGHLGQTFSLVATALSLGAFQTAAFRDSRIEEYLGIDGHKEFVTYVLGCGHVEDLARPAGISHPPAR